MTKNNEAVLTAVKEIFGESTDPEIIKKFKSVEDAINASDKEMTELLEKHSKLAQDYKDVILGTGTKTPPETIAEKPQEPLDFGEALARAINAAKPQA